MKKANKSEVISLRVEKKVKEQLEKMSADHRRELPDFLRLVLTDISNGKIKIDLY